MLREELAATSITASIASLILVFLFTISLNGTIEDMSKVHWYSVILIFHSY